jgi:hypothetical protein
MTLRIPESKWIGTEDVDAGDNAADVDGEAESPSSVPSFCCCCREDVILMYSRRACPKLSYAGGSPRIGSSPVDRLRA